MSSLNRRSFLVRGAALTGAAGAALAGGGARAAGMPPSSAGPETTPGGAIEGSDLATAQPFSGVHQSGILNHAPANATLVAFDSLAPDRATLVDALQALSARAR